MKNILPLIIVLATSTLFAQGKVGVNTENPTRTLDINGDMRLRRHSGTSIFNNYNQLLVADSEGNIDRISKQSMFLNQDTQVETFRSVNYYLVGLQELTTVRCGQFEFTISPSNVPSLRLLSPIEKQITIDYRLKRFERRINLTNGADGNGTGEYYDQFLKLTFTPENWDEYQAVYNESIPMLNNDSYKLHIIDSPTGDLYKIDFIRLITQDRDSSTQGTINTKDSGTRTIICERFFNTNN